MFRNMSFEEVSTPKPFPSRELTDPRSLRAMAHPPRPARAGGPGGRADRHRGGGGARALARQLLVPPAPARQVRLRRGGAGRVWTKPPLARGRPVAPVVGVVR